MAAATERFTLEGDQDWQTEVCVLRAELEQLDCEYDRLRIALQAARQCADERTLRVRELESAMRACLRYFEQHPSAVHYPPKHWVATALAGGVPPRETS